MTTNIPNPTYTHDLWTNHQKKPLFPSPSRYHCDHISTTYPRLLVLLMYIRPDILFFPRQSGLLASIVVGFFMEIHM